MTVHELLVELSRLAREGRGDWEVDVTLLNDDRDRTRGHLAAAHPDRPTSKVLLMGVQEARRFT